MVLVQGEKFRPTEIESKVDDTISKFLDFLKTIDVNKLDAIKKQTIEDLNEFSIHLEDVAEKYQSTIEE